MLTKQNFNLKLELHHRRERQTALEARLEEAEKQIEQQAELQEVNEQLLSELEKRDQAVEEAVGIIVSLEDKVESLMKEREVVRNFDVQYESSYFRPSHYETSSSPPTFTDKKTEAAMARMPSFLSEQSEGAEALRSLYLPSNQSYSDATLPKLLEEEEVPDRMDSPRLSLLSESSFLSIYGEKAVPLDQDEELERTHRKSSSVEKWIDDRPLPIATPARRKNQYLSINDVVESPLQRLEKLKLTLERNNSSVTSARLELERSTSMKEPRKPRDALRRVVTDKNSFDHQQGLPPTPDTISTSTLRHYQNSNDALAQDAHERTFFNSTSTFPVPIATRNIYQSTVSVRPRSAGETITSRREGHGWDTETQGDEFSSNASTFSAEQFNRSKQIDPPDMFTFGSFGDDQDGNWGRDMMFNNDSASQLPPHNASRHIQLRRNSVAEHPRSDDTITNRPMTRYNETQYGTSPIDTSPRPDPPDRRSSLGAATKLRKANGSNSSGQATVGNSPMSTKAPDTIGRKSRFATRLFGRSETSPAVSTFQQPSTKTKTSAGRANHLEGGYEDDDLARATPPPIKRNRESNLPRYRPSSAGAGMPQNTLRRGSAFEFGGDGAGDEPDSGRPETVDQAAGIEIDEGQVKAGSRKWLGFGRNGSMRRT